MIKRLTRTQLVRINKQTYLENGGQFIPPENLLHPEQLDYIVERVDSGMFDQEYYPTLADKAAFYLFSVVSNHVFTDGNKRTGLSAALTFLDINGYELQPRLTTGSTGDYEDDLIAYTIEVASGKVTLDECRVWFADNLVKQ